ncbi:hypothetical protein JAAARDRAFT_187660 [Jaapia argillacea MUCL 33604]|uniref:Peptidase C19 ubiquitin carboxyl-terminal hydrolase domain-containing protein n=1 Tax=Jaapia argillacea MUCL 33604 TaxID=933084 RepID=A0A067QNU8_9AGAM|nr:hypothetical protein JAAARDRAFT_187660 [Jaapia argillacea MUCL 33604]
MVSTHLLPAPLPQLPPPAMQIPPTPEEQLNIEILTGMMAGELDEHVARKVLRKHGGDMQKAASAILEGDRGEVAAGGNAGGSGSGSLLGLSGLGGGFGTGGSGSGMGTAGRPRSPPPSRPEHDRNVIDLTGDDEYNTGLSDALETNFGPSDRPPDQNWAMVRSDQAQGPPAGLSHDDHSLSRAIEASLTSSYLDFENEPFEVRPDEEKVRKDHRPMALRPTIPTIHYAALLLQALFFVPQVRDNIATWRATEPESETEDGIKMEESQGVDAMVIEKRPPPPPNPQEETVLHLVELFTNMDQAVLSELTVDILLADLETEKMGGGDSAGDLSANFLGRILNVIENVLNGDYANASPKRLFHFRYGALSNKTSLNEKSIVSVTINPNHPSQNELMGCLVAQFCEPGAIGTGGNAYPISATASAATLGGALNTRVVVDKGEQEVIYEQSDVVVFHLVRPPTYGSITATNATNTSSTNNNTNSKARATTPVPATSAPDGSKEGGKGGLFKYPKWIYLDQFLAGNAKIAREKRGERGEILEEVGRLEGRREGIGRFKGRDTFGDLTSAVYYYENVAMSDVEEEKEALKDIAIKLRKSLTRLENEKLAIDTKIAKLKKQADELFDCPELQQHRYDLRVVLVDDGVLGRKHLYSYVKYVGKWWKTVDDIVTEVTEDVVLNDPAGLHLGAGPYLLFYSRAMTEAEEDRATNYLDWPEICIDNVGHNNLKYLEGIPVEVAKQVIAVVGKEKFMEEVVGKVVAKDETMDVSPGS